MGWYDDSETWDSLMDIEFPIIPIIIATVIAYIIFK